MKKPFTHIVVKIMSGKKDIVCQSIDGKIGLIANDYRKSGAPMPEPGQWWRMGVLHETERYFIGNPEEQVDAPENE